MSALYRLLPSKASGLLPLGLVLVLLPLAVFVAGCDQAIEEEAFSTIREDNFYRNEQEFLNAANGVYAQVRTLEWDTHIVQEHTSDQTMVPTRGRDWGDGGIWRVLTEHDWSSTHPFITGAWEDPYVGIARSNAVLRALNNSEADLPARFKAEMRFLRALFYYQIMDGFGFGPIVVEQGRQEFGDFPTQPVEEPPPQNTRKEMFNFIVQELVGSGCTAGSDLVSCVGSPSESSVIANLPSKADVPYGRATEGAGYALLARILLNSEIYAYDSNLDGNGGSDQRPSAEGVGNGPEHFQAAADAASAVIDLNYQLEEDYFDNFTVDNYNSSEIIFSIPLIAQNEGGGLGNNLGMDFPQRVLHYNHPIPGQSAFNGWTTIRAFYEAHAVEPGPDGELGTRDDISNDDRIQQYIRGEQFNQPSANCIGNECFSDEESGETLVRNSDQQLEYTIDIPSITIPSSASNFQLEAPGLRPLKYELDPDASGSNAGNDVPLFRLAEMYLIRAESRARLNDLPGAINDLNEVRERAGLNGYGESGGPAAPSSMMETIQAVIQERGFEFMFELQRRQDLIRYEFAHGGSASTTPYYTPTFTGTWLFKDDVSNKYRVLFPIPSNQFGTNPNLRQIQGYAPGG